MTTPSRALMAVASCVFAVSILSACGPAETDNTDAATPAEPTATAPAEATESETPVEPETPPPEGTAALVAERCTPCHSLDRVIAADKDDMGWRTSVARMRTNGAMLTDAEADEIVKFLAGGGASEL